MTYTEDLGIVVFDYLLGIILFFTSTGFLSLRTAQPIAFVRIVRIVSERSGGNEPRKARVVICHRLPLNSRATEPRCEQVTGIRETITKALEDESGEVKAEVRISKRLRGSGLENFVLIMATFGLEDRREIERCV